MEKKEKSIIYLIICVVLLVIIWGGYIHGEKKIRQTIECVLEDDFSWVVQVDEVRTEKNEFVLEGFAFKLGKNAEKEAFCIVLHDLDTGEYLFPKMEYKERVDVNEYFLCEYDYTESGFVARIKASKLSLDENDYEVLLLPEWTHKPYQFATYLGGGELMYTNPEEYVPLDVQGTDLEGIVEGGVLRVYEPEIEMYVYQFGEELYWLADEGYVFEDDGDTYIDCMLGTTQIKLLPKERVEDKHIDDNRDFYFENVEEKNSDWGRFRVAKLEIPSEYAVTQVLTGHRENGSWVWNSTFRHYLINKDKKEVY